ncbi:MAG: gamma-glutamyltransferase, partial [bacterium]|nr:gamma-glutamyltransferase [bacterium]
YRHLENRDFSQRGVEIHDITLTEQETLMTGEIRKMDYDQAEWENHHEDASLWEGTSPRGIVVTAHYKATEAGVEILSEGGNAIDAAVASSLALGVVEPAGSGLGGMAMMMVYLAGRNRTFILEGPCRAPLAATPEKLLSLAKEFKRKHPEKAGQYNDEKIAGLVRKSGYQSVAVPTNPAVLGYALKAYGTCSPARVIEPAVRLAEEGYVITPFQYRLLKEYCSQIRKGSAASFLFGSEDNPPVPGTVLRQPVMANTLRRLAKAGFEDFYTGKIGRSILADMAKNNGFITAADLHEIPWPLEREPVVSTFGDWTIATMPPPGGGVVLIEMLNLFEELVPPDFDPDSPEAALLFAAIIRRARRDRRKYNLGEFTRSGEKAPDLAGKVYARKTAAKLRRSLDHRLGHCDFPETMFLEEIRFLRRSGGRNDDQGIRREPEESGETSHLNVIDRFGNVVALTQSIERSYGAKAAAPDLGFLYNGFLKGFKLRNRRHPHFLRPGAIARSNACPTIVFQAGRAEPAGRPEPGGRPGYAIGSTGSERMVSGIFQVIVRLLSQSPFEAVKAPRLHCTPEKQVFLEAGRFKPQALELLKKHKFELIPYHDWAFSVGGLHLAGQEPGKYWGVADPRRDGSAGGPKKVTG